MQGLLRLGLPQPMREGYPVVPLQPAAALLEPDPRVELHLAKDTPEN
jgi:hypothetical protein